MSMRQCYLQVWKECTSYRGKKRIIILVSTTESPADKYIEKAIGNCWKQKARKCLGCRNKQSCEIALQCVPETQVTCSLETYIATYVDFQHETIDSEG